MHGGFSVQNCRLFWHSQREVSQGAPQSVLASCRHLASARMQGGCFCSGQLPEIAPAVCQSAALCPILAQAEWAKWRKQCERDGRPQISMADVAAVRKRLLEAATCAGPPPRGMPLPCEALGWRLLVTARQACWSWGRCMAACSCLIRPLWDPAAYLIRQLWPLCHMPDQATALLHLRKRTSRLCAGTRTAQCMIGNWVLGPVHGVHGGVQRA